MSSEGFSPPFSLHIKEVMAQGSPMACTHSSPTHPRISIVSSPPMGPQSQCHVLTEGPGSILYGYRVFCFVFQLQDRIKTLA